VISLQQAAMNAIAAWLSSQLSGITVEDRWASASEQLAHKTISLIMAGPRRDTLVPERILSYTGTGPTTTSSRWQVKACEQDFQLDIWAKTDAERDDMLARLDIALNAGSWSFDPVWADPVGNGLLLPLVGDWADTTVSILWGNVMTNDEPEAVHRAEYRSTVLGTAHMMLAITKETAKQATINFKQRLSSTEVPSSGDADITTLTSAGESHSVG
jgi:hypothetical protein